MMWRFKNSARNEQEPVKTDNETLDFYIYSDVDEKSWWCPNSVGAEDFRKILEENPNAKNINLYINSYGGSVSEGAAIYSQLKRHSAYVTAYIDGFACSIASVIPMAADKVVMSECAVMMVHNPWTCACGNSADMRKCADDLDKILNGCIIPAYKNKINGKITEEKLRSLLDNEEFLTSAECLEYGFADEVAESSDSKEEAKDKYNKFVNEAKAHFMNSFKAEQPASQPEPEKEPEKTEPEVSDEPESKEEPAPEPEAPAPAEDKSNKAHELFMKMLKGEI